MSGIQQTGSGITFIFHFTAGGKGKTGLSPTVNVYDPSGTKVVDAGAVTAIADGLYKYFYANPSSAGLYIAVAKTTDTTVDQQELTSAWTVGMPWVQRLDADVSSRASSSAADDLALGIDTINDKVDSMPGAVWQNPERSLTEAVELPDPPPPGYGAGGEFVEDGIDFTFEWVGRHSLVLTDGAQYVHLRVRASQNGAPLTASQYSVSVAFATSRTVPRTWHSLEWLSADTARLLVGEGTDVELSAGNYYVFARGAAAPEHEAVQLPGVLEVL